MSLDIIDEVSLRQAAATEVTNMQESAYNFESICGSTVAQLDVLKNAIGYDTRSQLNQGADDMSRDPEARAILGDRAEHIYEDTVPVSSDTLDHIDYSQLNWSRRNPEQMGNAKLKAVLGLGAIAAAAVSVVALWPRFNVAKITTNTNIVTSPNVLTEVHLAADTEAIEAIGSGGVDVQVQPQMKFLILPKFDIPFTHTEVNTNLTTEMDVTITQPAISLYDEQMSNGQFETLAVVNPNDIEVRLVNPQYDPNDKIEWAARAAGADPTKIIDAEQKFLAYNFESICGSTVAQLDVLKNAIGYDIRFQLNQAADDTRKAPEARTALKERAAHIVEEFAIPGQNGTTQFVPASKVNIPLPKAVTLKTQSDDSGTTTYQTTGNYCNLTPKSAKEINDITNQGGVDTLEEFQQP